MQWRSLDVKLVCRYVDSYLLQWARPGGCWADEGGGAGMGCKLERAGLMCDYLRCV